MRNKRFAAVLALVVSILMLGLVFAVTACGSSGDDTVTTAAPATTGTTVPGDDTQTTAAPTKTETLEIGGSMPLSGPASVAGLAVANGWKAAVDKVNADGGHHCRRYQLHDSSSPQRTARAPPTARLQPPPNLSCSDNVKFIVGDISDNMANAIYAVSGKAGALYFNTLPVNGIDVTGAIGQPGPDKPLLLDSVPPESYEDIVAAKYLVENYPERQEDRRGSDQLLRLRFLQRALHEELGSAWPDYRGLRAI